MSPDHQTSDRAYRALKSDLLRGVFPGGLLNISMLSRRYGVSATPVREALLRLVGERLVVLPQGGGFAPTTLSEQDLTELYELNMGLLLMSVSSSTDRQPMRQELIEPSELDPPIDALFIAIATQSGNSQLSAMVAQLNDHLHRPRIVEQRRLNNLLPEFESIFETSGKRQKAAILRYHRRRIRSAAELILG